MKKWGLIALSLLLGATLYYFTVGKERLLEQMHTEVDQQLAVMAQQGFAIKKREGTLNDETIILRFEDPAKIAGFFQAQNIAMSPDDATLLRGFEVAIDLHYLPDSHHSLSADIYPLALPQALIEEKSDPQSAPIITHLEQMLQRKAILLHIAMSTTGSHFEGRMEDINETLPSKKPTHLTMQGFAFEGDMEQGVPHAIHQQVRAITLYSDDGVQIDLKQGRSDYLHTAQSLYDYTIGYQIQTITLQKADKIAMGLEKIAITSRSHTHDGHLDEDINTTIDKVSLTAPQQSYLLDGVALAMRANHLDIQALEALQNSSQSTQETFDKALQRLLSKGVTLQIPNFSIAHIQQGQQRFEGLWLHAKLAIEKGTDATQLRQNPLVLLDKADATVDLALSNDLFATIAIQPQAMMALMLFPPLDKNGKKHYTLTLQKGTLLLNGTRVK